jgi:hypothetical protein
MSTSLPRRPVSTVISSTAECDGREDCVASELIDENNLRGPEGTNARIDTGASGLVKRQTSSRHRRDGSSRRCWGIA